MSTMSWHASIAAALRMYDCWVVTLGPSLGLVFILDAASSVVFGVRPNSCWRTPSHPASGKRFEKEESDGNLITPRWIRREGSTLSENTGMLFVFGIGKGRGERDPKRIEMA